MTIHHQNLTGMDISMDDATHGASVLGIPLGTIHHSILGTITRGMIPGIMDGDGTMDGTIPGIMALGHGGGAATTLGTTITLGIMVGMEA